MHEFELYGASVFETVLSKRGQFWHAEQHWQRLHQSALTLQFEPPTFRDFLQGLLTKVVPEKNQVLRYTLLRTGGHWAFKPLGQETRVLCRDYQSHDLEHVRLHLPQQRLGCDDAFRLHKIGSRLPYQHLLSQALSAHCHDCLVLDTRDRILETCYSNILWCQEGRWLTPSASLGLLPGIFRQWLLESARVQEAEIRLDKLLASEGILICNSVRGLQPVERIGNHAIGLKESLRFIESTPPRVFTTPSLA